MRNARSSQTLYLHLMLYQLPETSVSNSNVSKILLGWECRFRGGRSKEISPFRQMSHLFLASCYYPTFPHHSSIPHADKHRGSCPGPKPTVLDFKQCILDPPSLTWPSYSPSCSLSSPPRPHPRHRPPFPLPSPPCAPSPAP